MSMDYLEISQRVLGKLQHNRGTGDVHDHLTLDTWEWPQGVALFAMYQTGSVEAAAELASPGAGGSGGRDPRFFRRKYLGMSSMTE